MGKTARIVLAALALAGLDAAAGVKLGRSEVAGAEATKPAQASPATAKAPLPRLVDIGAKTCIPCKKMAPILEELTRELASKLEVEFIDVSIRSNLVLAQRYGIRLIPTQLFLDPTGKELWRHEGFLGKDEILGKWKELGYDLSPAAAVLERWQPAQADQRPKDRICYMCDGDIDARDLVVVRTDKGDVRLCGPHHYFVMYSCLTEEKSGFEKRVFVTDWAAGRLVPATEAAYLRGLDAKTGRPWVRAFADRQAATKAMQASGGSILAWEVLQEEELARRCGFCDRAVYPQDGASVMVGGIRTFGCCSHCALGVAARTGKDIEVRERDRLSGQEIVVKTLNGSVASLEPGTAVAWFGMRQKPDGSRVSAGCFHQGFFASPENLKKWLEQNPRETGRQITIQQALADKMKLNAQQIQNACKIGECAPKEPRTVER